eukprot:COSAG02_NODE_5235_length_4517_cov_3.028067_1_plen_31_part_10
MPPRGLIILSILNFSFIDQASRSPRALTRAT